MVEIKFTKKTQQKYMLEWQDQDGINCGVSLLLVEKIIINNNTGVIDVYKHGYNIFTSTANKIILAVDLMLIGELFDVCIEVEGNSTIIWVELLKENVIEEIK